MKTFFILIAAVLTGFCGVIQADIFTDAFGDFNDNQAGGAGITFTPAKATIKPPSTVVPQIVFLVDWTFAKSSSGYGGSGLTYLAVTNYDSVTGYGDILGVSTNYIDFPATANGALITWQFDYIALDKDTEYALLFVTPDGAGGFNVADGGIELEVSTDYPWGGFIQTGYTIVNQPDWNAHFEATYSTTTPYPYSLYPTYGAENVPTDVTLSWEAANDYTPLGYNVYLDPNDLNLNSDDATYYSLSQSELTFTPSPNLNSNTTYYWRVEAIDPNDGGTPFVHASPVFMFTTQPDNVLISGNPISQTVSAGTAQVEFSITALNAETYQWFKDGTVLTADPAIYTGENTATLTIYDIQVADEGLYACQASNSIPSSATSQAALLITERLAGWWKLDGDLTDSVALAVPGAVTHDGTSPDPNFVVDGIDGQALEMFGDVPGLVTITESSELFNFYPQGYSVSAWVNMAEKVSTDPWGAFVCKQGFDPVRSGFILTNDGSGKAVHTLRQMTPNDLSSNVDVDDSSWHLVTGTYDAATKESKVYVDGILANQVTYTGIPTGNPSDIIFGAEIADATVAPYLGQLDDVRIWSYPLGAYDVAILWTDFNPGATVCVQEIPMDVSGPEGTPDCVVNLYDFVIIAQEWLSCNRVPSSSCIE